ncbi:MAG: EamA family transporter RarD [Rhizobiaceae bacterium]
MREASTNRTTRCPVTQLKIQENRDTKEGFIYAGAAYLIWGFLPFYMKALAHVPSIEVVAHRILWSIPLSLVILYFLGLLSGVKKALSSPRTILMGALTATIISLNWGVYVWAVGAGRALETALGYYINPLFSVFLAAVLLGERLNRPQMLAIGLAVIAVAILTWDAGGLPWVSLALTFSWGAYAYFKKTLPVGPTEGFLLEVLLLSIPALGYVVWLAANGQGHFFADGGFDMWLLAGTGFVTAIPLILYANGAKLLRLSTIAIMQYSAPTMIFLIAVFIFKEPFSQAKLAAFGFIWLALAIYTWSLVKIHQASK